MQSINPNKIFSLPSSEPLSSPFPDSFWEDERFMLKYLGPAFAWIIYQWVAYVKYVLKAYIKFVLYTNQLQACALGGGVGGGGGGSLGDLAYTDGCII